MPKMQKPIRVFYSELSGKFYASRAFKSIRDGHTLITGEKFDVTSDIGSAVIKHRIKFTKTRSKP